MLKIYLDEPLVIDGTKIGHTYNGLKYMIKHYEHILTNSTPQQLDDNGRQHIEKLITHYQFSIVLYEKANSKTENPT